MQLLVSKDSQCLLYSVAMLLEVTPWALIDQCGHDGHEILWPILEKPFCYRGHHIQEMQECCVSRGKILAPWQNEYLLSQHPALGVLETYPRHSKISIEEILQNRKALLLTRTHAVAWSGENVYDPQGFITSLDKYLLEEIWLFCSTQ